MPGAARAGVKPELILQKIRSRIVGSGFPNLLVFQGGGGVETCGGMLAGINEMLLQSYESIIRVFPNWPKDKPARFVALRAVGAFLVSSEYRDGIVQYVDIFSEKGRPCVVQNPWPGGTVSISQELKGKRKSIAAKVTGDRMSFPTKAGGIYRLTCEKPPATVQSATDEAPQSDVIITGPPECLLTSGEQIRTDGHWGFRARGPARGPASLTTCLGGGSSRPAQPLKTPIRRNLARRRSSNSDTDTPDSAARCRETSACRVAIAAAGSRCAPPIGSGSTPSTTSSRIRSPAVSLSASAASGPFLPSRHRSRPRRSPP